MTGQFHKNSTKQNPRDVGLSASAKNGAYIQLHRLEKLTFTITCTNLMIQLLKKYKNQYLRIPEFSEADFYLMQQALPGLFSGSYDQWSMVCQGVFTELAPKISFTAQIEIQRMISYVQIQESGNEMDAFVAFYNFNPWHDPDLLEDLENNDGI